MLCVDSSGNVLAGSYLAGLGQSELLQQKSLSCGGKLELSLNMNREVHALQVLFR